MGLFTDRYITTDVGVGAVFLQETVTTDQDLLQPFQDLRIVDDLMLYQLLGDGEQNLGTRNEPKINYFVLYSYQRR